ncbi:MAG: hypothetical protein GY927_20480 [bacterium]|nr:hypothetical protein [bacterium]
MSTPAKFMFDTLLDAPAAPPPIAYDKVEQLKLDHAQELERVKAQSYEEGFEAGRIESDKTLEHELHKMLDQIIQTKETLQSEIDAELREARSASLLLAMTIANKLAGSLLVRHPLEHVEMFFLESLSMLPDKTELRLHVAPHLAPALQPRLNAVMERNGQQSALVTVEDQTIEGGNCRLTWNEGGIEQNTDKLYADIERLIETCLYSNTETQQSEAADKTGSTMQ